MPEEGRFAVTLAAESYFRIQIPKGISSLLSLRPRDKIEVIVRKMAEEGRFAVTLADEIYFRVQIPKGIIDLLELMPGDKIEVVIRKMR